MLQTVMEFILQAENSVERGANPADIAGLPILRRMYRLGEEFGEDDIKRIDLLRRQISYDFESLRETQQDAS